MRTVLRLPNWVGDAILALPTVEAAARALPGSICLAGRELPLLLARRVAPEADALALTSRAGRREALWREVRQLRDSGIERGILLTPSFSAALWLRAAGVAERWGWPEQRRGFLLNRPVPRGPRGSAHLTQEFAALLEAAGVGSPADHPRLPADPQADQQAAEFLSRHGLDGTQDERGWIALCPGVQYGPAKQWPAERFTALAARLAERGWRGVVIGSPAERGQVSVVCRAAGRLDWIAAAGEGTLLFAAELLRRAQVAVCNDTGAMHLAAAVATPVVALFGPTDPAWTGPRGPKHRILWKRASCAPCYRRRCPFAQPAPCMAALSVEEVVMATEDRAAIAGEADEGSTAGVPALFLDRDGTLIEAVPYLRDAREVRLIGGSAAALRRAREAGFRLVVITNQSGIARGLFTREEMDAVHAAVRKALAMEGVSVDEFYFCPHHPDHTGPCECRKPAPGMLHRAARELSLDLARSFVIGDTIEDLLAGARAGTGAILVRTGYGAEQWRQRADELPPGARVAEDLAAALDLILAAAERDAR